MNATLQDTFLDLFQQVSEDPENIPDVPIEAWQEGSKERHLLTSFCDMLARMQQSRQEAEDQLREKEAQYRAIFEASSDGLFVSDLEDGHVVEVNPAACRQLGYTYEELNRPSPHYLHPPSFSSHLRRVSTNHQSGRPVSGSRGESA